MRWLLPLLVVAPLVAGCASDQERYCDAVEEHQTELTEILGEGGQAALLEALPVYRDLRAEAPRDIVDEWDQVIDSLGALDRALEDAGVDAASYDPKRPPDGVTTEQQDAIAAAADEVGSLKTREALAGVEQQARDVCHSPLSL